MPIDGHGIPIIVMPSVLPGGGRRSRRRPAGRRPPRQAQRLATALRALMVGLSQGVILGLADAAPAGYLAATARALITPDVLGPP